MQRTITLLLSVAASAACAQTPPIPGVTPESTATTKGATTLRTTLTAAAPTFTGIIIADTNRVSLTRSGGVLTLNSPVGYTPIYFVNHAAYRLRAAMVTNGTRVLTTVPNDAKFAFLSATTSAVPDQLQSALVTWDYPPQFTNVNRFGVYYGQSSSNYPNMLVTTNKFATISNLVAGITHYIAATAINTLGLESDYSPATSYRPPRRTP